MVELVTFGETPLHLSPPGKERIETAREMTVYADGIESNAAVAASQLGTSSTWVSKLPAAPLSRRIVGELERHGIETSITWASHTERRQGLVFRETGHPPRESQQWHDRENTAVATAKPGDLPMDAVQSATAVYTGLRTATLSETTESTVTELLATARAADVTTVFDVDHDPEMAQMQGFGDSVDSLLAHVDVLMGNESHIRAVFDQSGTPRELVNTIAADYDLDTVVVTRGKHGAVALEDTPGSDVLYERETSDSTAVDESGHHGAFAGGFLSRLSDGAAISEALSYGVAAATLVRTVPGPFLTASRSEIERVVDDVTEATQ
jgi:2-dehydro-3-deoxygluconokinase